MAARTSIARCARLFSSPRAFTPLATPQWRCASLATTRPSPIAARARNFSSSSRILEKKYTEDHEWVELDTDGKTVTLGISSYAANALGDVVYVELPEADLDVSAGDAIGSVESVKSASDILTPVSGTVVETNGSLEETPGTLNRDPEGKGWIARIQIAGGSLEESAEGLMDAEAYRKFTEDAAGEE